MLHAQATKPGSIDPRGASPPYAPPLADRPEPEKVTLQVPGRSTMDRAYDNEASTVLRAIGANVFGVPELPEMEIVAQRLANALPGRTIESVMTPGINVLKTFDPPLSALEGAEIADVRRRGKLLLLEASTD